MDALRLFSIFISVSAIPPIYYLISKMNGFKKNKANRLIARMLYGFLAIAILNTVVTLFSVVGLGVIAHSTSFTVRTITSAVISAVAWAMYFTSKEE